jgi:hypothetical protein
MEEDNTKPPNRYIHTEVTIDGDWSFEPDNFTAPLFPCVLNPHQRWNGWACPFFTKETLDLVAQKLGLTINWSEPEIFNPQEEDDEFLINSTTIEGELLYYIDGWTWMWIGDVKQ